MERVSKRLGRLILGDTPVSPMQQATDAGRESAEARTGMSERQVAQPEESRPRGFEPHVYEGVSVAERPRQKQIGCETCGQSLEPHQRRIKCHVGGLWIHDVCLETLQIGDKWNADMCLACQQRLTRKLRVIKAIELRRAVPWCADRWV